MKSIKNFSRKSDINKNPKIQKKSFENIKKNTLKKRKKLEKIREKNREKNTENSQKNLRNFLEKSLHTGLNTEGKRTAGLANIPPTKGPNVFPIAYPALLNIYPFA